MYWPLAHAKYRQAGAFISNFCNRVAILVLILPTKYYTRLEDAW
jgi:hypothetical protein